MTPKICCETGDVLHCNVFHFGVWISVISLFYFMNKLFVQQNVFSKMKNIVFYLLLRQVLCCSDTNQDKIGCTNFSIRSLPLSSRFNRSRSYSFGDETWKDRQTDTIPM